MNTILFDLDGTLLPMDQDLFIQSYFGRLEKKFEELNLAAQTYIKAVWKGTKSMLVNNGEKRNEERFWDQFAKELGEESRNLEPEFQRFYENEFQEVQKVTGNNPYAKSSVELLRKKGYQLVLATNPIFPKVATHSRISWAGLSPQDFDHITTYDNTRFCKPNIEYYNEILKQLGKTPEECLMIGNDVADDMCAAQLGIRTYLVTDCLINGQEASLDSYVKGNFEELYHFLLTLPDLKEAKKCQNRG